MIIPIAAHLMQGAYELLRKPPLKLIGVVWEFAFIPQEGSRRFKNPFANLIAKNFLSLSLHDTEYPISASLRLNFRKRLPEAISFPNVKDYLAAIIGIRDAPFAETYEKATPPPSEEGEDPPRLGILTIDIQHHFDPRKPFSAKMLEEHLATAKRYFSDRLSELLKV